MYSALPFVSATCALVLSIVYSNTSLKLQSGICGQFIYSVLIIGEEEDEKMTKVHDYPKEGENLYSYYVVSFFWW